MGWWTTHAVPRIVDKVCNLPPAPELRARVCAPLTGDVVEIGFGSGLNLPHYPSTVSSVTAIEPSDVGWRLARDRVAASPVPVRRGGLDGQRLPFDDDSFDSAVSTWTLCTVPDPAAALAELRRVLRPGGVLRFVEHGLAPDASVQRWQHRLDPLQKRIAGGCHLTREPEELMPAAGFELTELDRFYEKGAPRLVAADRLGTAVAP